jgi:hypothetical protein
MIRVPASSCRMNIIVTEESFHDGDQASERGVNITAVSGKQKKKKKKKKLSKIKALL